MVAEGLFANWEKWSEGVKVELLSLSECLRVNGVTLLVWCWVRVILGDNSCSIISLLCYTAEA